MKRSVIRNALIITVIWAGALYYFAGKIPDESAELLGFVGALLLFIPAISGTLQAISLKDVPDPDFDPDQIQIAYSALRVRTASLDFNWIQALANFAGISLVALAFGTKYIS